MNRIKQASRWFKILFLTAAVAFALSDLGPIIQALAGLTWDFFAIANSLICALAAWFCYRLFDLYSCGQLFSADNVRYMNRIGWVYFLAMLNLTLHQAVPGGFHFPNGVSSLAWPVVNLIGRSFPCFLIFFTAWITDEGRKIREEQELTV